MGNANEISKIIDFNREAIFADLDIAILVEKPLLEREAESRRLKKTRIIIRPLTERERRVKVKRLTRPDDNA